MTIGDRELVLADLPGLLEGASEGRGLETSFAPCGALQSPLFCGCCAEEILLAQSTDEKSMAKQSGINIKRSEPKS